jgi:hypothetical protein
VLTRRQRESYFETGYLLLESFVSEAWLERLWEVTDRLVEESRSRTRSDTVFDLEPDHSAQSPRLRRISHPVELDPVYEEFGLGGPIVDIAEDLLGPDLKFHHSKLNLKWSGGGEEVKWHQDIQFYPHTNYSPLTIGVYMTDVGDEMAPMGVVPGSQNGELFDLYDDDEQWTGAIKERDLARVDLASVVWLKGPKGSVTVHNCRTVHGSTANHSPRFRPLLLHSYAAADAIHLTSLLDNQPHSNTIIRGRAAKWIEYDPRPCLMPPDWSAGYTSIFALQQEDAGNRTAAE